MSPRRGLLSSGLTKLSPAIWWWLLRGIILIYHRGSVYQKLLLMQDIQNFHVHRQYTMESQLASVFNEICLYALLTGFPEASRWLRWDTGSEGLLGRSRRKKDAVIPGSPELWNGPDSVKPFLPSTAYAQKDSNVYTCGLAKMVNRKKERVNFISKCSESYWEISGEGMWVFF